MKLSRSEANPSRSTWLTRLPRRAANRPMRVDERADAAIGPIGDLRRRAGGPSGPLGLAPLLPGLLRQRRTSSRGGVPSLKHRAAMSPTQLRPYLASTRTVTDHDAFAGGRPVVSPGSCGRAGRADRSVGDTEGVDERDLVIRRSRVALVTARS